MKIVLYIGHHKVGSTALQVFLSQNSLKLMRAGILYPAVEMRSFAHLLAKAVKKGDEPAYLPGNVREPHSALAYQMISSISERPVPPQYRMLPSAEQMMHAIRCQIEELEPHTVVLCSEAFANFGEVSSGLIVRLREALPEAEIEIYCGLRRPDQYLVAWHGQRLKVAEPLPALRDIGHRAYARSIHYNFRKVIGPWHQKMPQARVILRNYADILASGGSPEDFMAQTGVDWPEGLLPVGKPNPSLPLAAMEIVREANAALPRPLALRFCKHVMENAGSLETVPDDEVEMFGPGDRRRLVREFRAVHQYLSGLADVPAFFPDLEEATRDRPVPELEAAAQFLAQLDPQAMPAPEIADFVATLQADYRKRRA